MEKSAQERFRPLVEERIKEIQASLAESSREETDAISPDVSIGRLSRMDSMQMQQIALAGKRRKEEELRDLKDALRRLEQGRYGTCQLCGRDIAEARLEYQPTAVSCVACLEKSVRR